MASHQFIDDNVSFIAKSRGMYGLETQKVQCPYCWEIFEIVIDCSESEQEYIEDCYVCCHPIDFRIYIEGDQVVEVVVGRAN